MTDTSAETTSTEHGYTSRSDRAGVIAVMLAIVGILIAVALGFGVGAADLSSDFDNAGASLTTSGPDFNWLLAILGATPFIIGGCIAWAASWVLAQMEQRP